MVSRKGLLEQILRVLRYGGHLQYDPETNRVQVDLALPPDEFNAALSASEPPPVRSDRTSAKLSECAQDIVAVLSAAGRQLTADEVLVKLETEKKLHGDSTVRRTLSRLATRGVIQSSTKKPYGYSVLT